MNYMRKHATEKGTVTVNATMHSRLLPFIHLRRRFELEYLIVPSPGMDLEKMGGRRMGGLNGYVVFPKRPLIETGYDGIAGYVPVHGGITYAEQDGEEMIYGFDTCHYNSQNFPLLDPNWIREQIKIMAKGLLVAATVEKAYLTTTSNEKKAKLIQEIYDVAPDADKWNTTTAINLLGGKL